MTNDYIMKEVIPRNGRMRDIHEEVLGCRCYIIALEKGERGFIKFEPRYDYGHFHRLHTSLVRDWTESDDCRRVTVETENTTYVMEALNSITEYYEDAYNFSRSIAMKDVEKYLYEQDDEYFTSRGTTKEKVLTNDMILADIAQEHYKCVMCFGNEREWSCKDACDNDPGIVR